MVFDPLTVIYGSIVGLSLGLTGGGGSILAIPILVYGLGIPMSQAVVISLLMVAIIALFGAAKQSFSGDVDWRAAILFSIAGMIISPIVIYVAHDVNETLRIILFAALMLFVAYKMAFSGKKIPAPINTLSVHKPSIIRAVMGGSAAGGLSGFFGVGGGFIIVPLLTMIFTMPYRKAVSTSLAAIFLISTTAVAGAYLKGISLDWSLFALFVVGGLGGMIAGTILVNFIPERPAKIIFAAITTTLAVFMLIERLFLHQGGAQ
ncbi:MAG: hypothetical protein A3J37_06040 [Alphaproteobacteria bacterium RIFCSPHIGHO2_12_FULL_45_9]|nr:MAG: hypothetical protein A3B66_05770 [Alphaproteobacteria bacterium RIFCSPHIGHO2_02_FULL_46_13]OFW96185.1 MAG: hypothetical protein A3J37_06040 [Alphaproteobacteria bacterium RIFCSPHIGHO2_12_FULL_45_9]